MREWGRHPRVGGHGGGVAAAPQPLPLAPQGGRSYSWLTEENLFYANWQDGEPQQVAGCSYMDADGSWRTAGCDTKLQGGICQLRSGARGAAGGALRAPQRELCAVGGGVPPGPSAGAPALSLWGWVAQGAPTCCGTPSTPCPPPEHIVCPPPGATRAHKWSYSGSCPKSLEDSSWIPFRDHCYTFHMEITLGQKDAMRRCQKGRRGLREKGGPQVAPGCSTTP